MTEVCTAMPPPDAYSPTEQVAHGVLENNFRETFITPSDEHYGNKGRDWAYEWDTMFAIMEIAHHDIDRAKLLFDNFMAPQHKNGMVPHMIMWHSNFPSGYLISHINWKGPLNRRPDLRGNKVNTSTITQPPMVALAAAEILRNITDPAERAAYAQQVAPSIIKYHKWLYAERELDHNGLLATLHSHETGRDDALSHKLLMANLGDSALSRLLLGQKAHDTFHKNRSDGTNGLDDRSDTATVMLGAYLSVFHTPPKMLRDKKGNVTGISPKHPYVHYDTGFNSIADRANDELRYIAETAGITLESNLLKAFDRTTEAIRTLLWDEEGTGFRGIDGRGNVTLEAGQEVGDLLPLLSRHIFEHQANALFDLLEDRSDSEDEPSPFGGTNLPSVNRRNPAYDPARFWQGADWPQIRTLLITSMYNICKERADFSDETRQRAQRIGRQLAKSAVERAMASGDIIPEYHNGTTGEPGGAGKDGKKGQFTWGATMLLHAIRILRLKSEDWDLAA